MLHRGNICSSRAFCVVDVLPIWRGDLRAGCTASERPVRAGASRYRGRLAAIV